MIMRIALEDSQLGASIGGRCVSNLCVSKHQLFQPTVQPEHECQEDKDHDMCKQ